MIASNQVEIKRNCPDKLKQLIPEKLLTIKTTKLNISKKEVDNYINKLFEKCDDIFNESMLEMNAFGSKFKCILEISHPDTQQKYIRFITTYDGQKKKRYVAQIDSENNIIKLKPNQFQEFVTWLVENGMVFEYFVESIFC